MPNCRPDKNWSDFFKINFFVNDIFEEKNTLRNIYLMATMTSDFCLLQIFSIAKVWNMCKICSLVPSKKPVTKEN